MPISKGERHYQLHWHRLRFICKIENSGLLMSSTSRFSMLFRCSINEKIIVELNPSKCVFDVFR